MDAIFQNIWEMSLFAIPVILVFALCSKFLGKRYGAKWRYLLWLVIAVRLCIPVQLDLPEPMMGMQIEVPSVQNGARDLLETKNPDYLMISDAEKMELKESLDVLPTLRTDVMVQTKSIDSSNQDFIDFFLAYPDMLWLLGVILFLAW